MSYKQHLSPFVPMAGNDRCGHKIRSGCTNPALFEAQGKYREKTDFHIPIPMEMLEEVPTATLKQTSKHGQPVGPHFSCVLPMFEWGLVPFC